MKWTLHIIYVWLVAIGLSACYNQHQSNTPDAYTYNDSIEIADSVSFYSAHHYSIGYNFVVYKDSLLLIKQQPEEHISLLVTDTFAVRHNTHIAVTDIRILPQDTVDSVWVQLVTEEGLMGWNHEKELLAQVVPTDPISQIIMTFSDMHVMIALIILAMLVAGYTINAIQRKKAPLIHIRDIPSFYPTLLCIIVAVAATFYASLQMFGPDTWRHFYYHPTLNPFQLPPILCIFILSIWAMLIIGIAAVEDVKHYLDTGDAILYLIGLAGVCGVLYIVFSITTLYYVGYPLLVAYCWFAVTHYLRHSSQHYICGACGKRIKAPGECPHCGAINEENE